MGTLSKLTLGMDKGDATSMSTSGHIPSETVEPRAFGEGQVSLTGSAQLSASYAQYQSQKGLDFPYRRLYARQAESLIPTILKLGVTKKLTVMGQGNQRVFVGSLDGSFRTTLSGADWDKVETLFSDSRVRNLDFRQSLPTLTRLLRPLVRATFPSVGLEVRSPELDVDADLTGLEQFFSAASVPTQESVSTVTELSSLSGDVTLSDPSSVGLVYKVVGNEPVLEFDNTAALTSFDVSWAEEDYTVVHVEDPAFLGNTNTLWSLADSTGTNNFILLQRFQDFGSGDQLLRLIGRDDLGNLFISSTFLIPDTDPFYTVTTVQNGLVNVWFRRTLAIEDFDISANTLNVDNFTIGGTRRTSLIFVDEADWLAAGYSSERIPDSQRLAISQSLEVRYGIAST